GPDIRGPVHRLFHLPSGQRRRQCLPRGPHRRSLDGIPAGGTALSLPLRPAGRALPALPALTAPVPAASPWRQSLEAARANLIPGLVLQAFALAVVLAYYNHEPTRAGLDSLAAFKTRWGWSYSLLATSLFGGLIPFLYLRGSLATRAATPFSHGVFFVLFWAMKGVEVDMFYRFQGWLFGEGVDMKTIACKLAVDQFVYSIIWSTPTTM